MKIKKLIKIYKKLIHIYTKRKPENCGICGHAYIFCHNKQVYNLFSINGYYKNYIDSNCSLKGPSYRTAEGHKFRIKFMKNQIPILENLLEKGYTYI